MKHILIIDSKVDLLFGGAVDYVTKPFNTKELLVRIAVQLRNAASAHSVLIRNDGFSN